MIVVETDHCLVMKNPNCCLTKQAVRSSCNVHGRRVTDINSMLEEITSLDRFADRRADRWQANVRKCRQERQESSVNKLSEVSGFSASHDFAAVSQSLWLS